MACQRTYAAQDTMIKRAPSVLSLPHSWMMALDFSLGAAGGGGSASMHDAAGTDGCPSACQRLLMAFGAILEPYDPHRRWLLAHGCAETLRLLGVAVTKQ